jgi:O-antigen/teichoic acid export membrane protein
MKRVVGSTKRMAKMTHTNKIAKNLFFVSFGEIVSKFLMFIILVYLARILGPENYGKWGFVFSLVSFFYITSALGLDTFGAREIAKNEKKSVAYLNRILSIKVVLGALNYLILIIVVFLLPQGTDVKILLAIYGLSIFSNSSLIEFFFQGRQDMLHLGIGKIIRAIVLVVLAFIFVRSTNDLIILGIVYVIAHFSTNIYLFYYGFKGRKFKFDLSNYKPYLKISLILGLSVFLSSVNFQIDQILLAFMDTFQNLGIYEAAVKVIFLTMVAAGILWMVFMPVIAKKLSNKKELSDLFLHYTRLVLLIGFFCFGLTFFFSDIIIKLLYGASYSQAAGILLIISFAVIFQFLNVLFVSPLYVLGKDKQFLFAVMSGAIVNVILNLILIPKYSIYGAAYATIISYAIICLYGYFAIRKSIKFNYVVFLKYVIAITGCGVILKFVNLNIFVKVIIFCVSYFGLLFILREIKLEDYTYVKSMLMGRKHE